MKTLLFKEYIIYDAYLGTLFESPNEKTINLHMPEQRRRSASQ